MPEMADQFGKIISPGIGFCTVSLDMDLARPDVAAVPGQNLMAMGQTIRRAATCSPASRPPGVSVINGPCPRSQYSSWQPSEVVKWGIASLSCHVEPLLWQKFFCQPRPCR